MLQSKNKMIAVSVVHYVNSNRRFSKKNNKTEPIQTENDFQINQNAKTFPFSHNNLHYYWASWWYSVINSNTIKTITVVDCILHWKNIPIIIVDCNFLVTDSGAVWFACATRKTQFNDHFRQNRIHFSHLTSIQTTIARSRRLSFSLATNFRIGCHLQSHYYDGQHQYRQSLLVCGINPFIRWFVRSFNFCITL